MSKGRMEAFSDGVLAIIITIMVLELRVPQTAELAELKPLLSVLLSYALSFIFIGIYWNNHHHMLQATKQVDGRVLWANMHLLFWLSLIPFTTAWMGGTRFAEWPVAIYGVVLLLAGTAYYHLAHELVSLHGLDSVIGKALGTDRKGKASLLIYAIAVPITFLHVWFALALYVVVDIMWLVPDRRIEKTLHSKA